MKIERDLDYILTSEMTSEEWEKFRLQWIEELATDLIKECGEPNDESTRILASVHFEVYCSQEGWRGRDEKILLNREHDRVS